MKNRVSFFQSYHDFDQAQSRTEFPHPITVTQWQTLSKVNAQVSQHGEYINLGIEVSQTTVAKYVPRRLRPPSPAWRAFLPEDDVEWRGRTTALPEFLLDRGCFLMPIRLRV